MAQLESQFDESPEWQAKCVTMFANRVAKNAKHLHKWAKREAITAYRIYDQDIPEVPITVDRYADALVINDYRMHDEDGRRRGGDGWLDAMAAAASATCQIETDLVFVKRRERLAHRAADQQYQRGEERTVSKVVTEAGLEFVVNLSEYVDTGLFLDHRTTRNVATAERFATATPRMLNLYCYTGAFSVYAATRGFHTVSVDMSRTYLEWAQLNFEQNQLPKDGHEFVQRDVREFLRIAKQLRRKFDLVVVDPPTFSNSARMDYTWDVQRDHPLLLADVASIMAPGGVIWFSTNRRKFAFHAGSLPAFADATISDETEATIPTDFRDRKVHRAWRIRMPG